MTDKKPPRIFLSPPHLSSEGYEQEFVQESFDTNWIAPIGPQVDAFEREFAEYTGVPYAVALSSGSAAIHLALINLGVEQGDEVYCSSLTFSASANPIFYQKATPVFIDSEKETWNMDPGLLEETLKADKKKNRLPKAVVVVDLYGQSANYGEINRICREYGVPIIEDAAEALGASYNGKKTGNFGEIGVYSFNGNKIITTSGGGMMVSHNKSFVDKARFLSTQARENFPHYEHKEIGFNYRLSGVLAGLGRGQLKVLDQRVQQRRKICDYYKKHLEPLPGITFMPEPEGYFSNRWLTVIMIDPAKFGVDTIAVREELERQNIEARPVWKPMHLQPIFKKYRSVGGAVSEEMFEKGLCLPSGTAMTEQDLDRVIGIIKGQQKA